MHQASPVSALALLVAWNGVAAQELPLRTDLAQVEWFACPPWSPEAEATPEMKGAARELSSNANESLALGDARRARELLAEALALDPTSADLHYGYARVVEGLGAYDEAIAHLCHALALPAPPEQSLDAQQRLRELASMNLDRPPPEAERAFSQGVSLARAGRSAAAADAFQSAVEVQPSWPEARYNLGIVLGAMGEHARGAEQLQHYLSLSPRAADAALVSRVIGRWEAENTADSYSRPTAFTLGLVVPGMGQLSTGRPTTGLAVLAAAGGAIAAGMFVRRVAVRCLDQVGPGEKCASDRVVSRQERRPYLGLSIATASVVTLLGALDAYFCWACGGRAR